MKNNLTIYKDNYLIEASYKLTLIEQRLMLFCISKLNPDKPEQKQTIRVDEFIKFFPDIDKKNVYRQIKEAIEILFDRVITLKDPEYTEAFRWISLKKYMANEGSAVIHFSNEIMPYLFKLEKQFTKYNLKNISSFKSTYSIRMYELLIQYESLGKRVIELDKLRNILLLENKFNDWYDFQKRIIKPSIEEINAKSDLDVEYKQIKKGRAVFALEFIIKNKKNEIKKTKKLKRKINKKTIKFNRI